MFEGHHTMTDIERSVSRKDAIHIILLRAVGFAIISIFLWEYTQ